MKKCGNCRHFKKLLSCSPIGFCSIKKKQKKDSFKACKEFLNGITEQEKNKINNDFIIFSKDKKTTIPKIVEYVFKHYEPKCLN